MSDCQDCQRLQNENEELRARLRGDVTLVASWLPQEAERAAREVVSGHATLMDAIRVMSESAAWKMLETQYPSLKPTERWAIDTIRDRLQRGGDKEAMGERVRQAFLAGELAMKQRVIVAIGPPLSLDEDERAKLVELLMSGGEL